jgi:hypothetical protein
VVVCHQRVVASLVCGARTRAGDHGAHHGALARRARGDQAVEVEARHGGADRLDMAVVGGGGNLEALAGPDERSALERSANQLDQPLGEVEEVADGLILDAGAVAEAAAQEVGGVDRALVFAPCGDDVDCAMPTRRACCHMTLLLPSTPFSDYRPSSHPGAKLCRRLDNHTRFRLTALMELAGTSV